MPSEQCQAEKYQYFAPFDRLCCARTRFPPSLPPSAPLGGGKGRAGAGANAGTAVHAGNEECVHVRAQKELSGGEAHYREGQTGHNEGRPVAAHRLAGRTDGLAAAWRKASSPQARARCDRV